jgi:hypothetical protein
MTRAAVAFLLVLPAAAQPPRGPGERPKPGATEYVIGGITIPMVGVPLAATPAEAVAVRKLYEADRNETVVRMCDGGKRPFLRSMTRVTVRADDDPKSPAVAVEVAGGPHKGKAGFIDPRLLAPGPLPVKGLDLEKYPEPVRKRVYARHYEMLTEAFAETGKAFAGPGDPEGRAAAAERRYEFEAAALKAFARKLDAARADLKVETVDDWQRIVRLGLAAGWPARYAGR